MLEVKLGLHAKFVDTLISISVTVSATVAAARTAACDFVQAGYARHYDAVQDRDSARLKVTVNSACSL